MQYVFDTFSNCHVFKSLMGVLFILIRKPDIRFKNSMN